MSNNESLREQILEIVEEANLSASTHRHVTPGAALTVVERSFTTHQSSPLEVQEFHALRELSAFIALMQANKVSDTYANHTDLLPISHPASTRAHAMTASGLIKARLRWTLADSRISEEAGPLLAAAFLAEPNSVEYVYAVTRLNALPAGSYPLEALVAAFGDGNSREALSQRAMLQRRDRKGRFAYQGGGGSALIERVSGIVERLTGRPVSMSQDGNTVRMELPDGRLVDVPTNGVEFIKAVINPTNDGYAGVPAKYNTGDPVTKEEDLKTFDAPHGFEKDNVYSGPGVQYTDDSYNVVKKDDGSFLISRRGMGEDLGTANSWSEAQKMIQDDDENLAKAEGREPIARLTPEQIERMYDDNFDPNEIETPGGGSGDGGSGDGGSGDEPPQPPAGGGDFEYQYPEGAYQLPTNVQHMPGTNPLNDSEDYTDDPAEIAQMFPGRDGAQLIGAALQQALLPQGNSNVATGFGELPFEFDEPVPAEALYLALEELGVDAKKHTARVYDTKLDGSPNLDAYTASRETPVARIPEAPKTPLSTVTDEEVAAEVKRREALTPTMVEDAEGNLIYKNPLNNPDPEVVRAQLEEREAAKSAPKVETPVAKIPETARAPKAPLGPVTDEEVAAEVARRKKLTPTMVEDSKGNLVYKSSYNNPDPDVVRAQLEERRAAGNDPVPEAETPAAEIEGLEGPDLIDGTYKYKGKTLRKVYGKWAVDGGGYGQQDTVEDLINEIDTIESQATPEGIAKKYKASLIRKGDWVKHNGKWKKVKEVTGTGFDSTLNFEDGTSVNNISKVFDVVIPEPDPNGLIDNRDGTYTYKGVKLKKVFGKWTGERDGLGKNDTIEDLMAKIDAPKSGAQKAPATSEAPAAEAPTAETPETPAEVENALPEIGGGWTPTQETNSGRNLPAYRKQIDGVTYEFSKEADGQWYLSEVRGEDYYLPRGEGRVSPTADADAFENLARLSEDVKQKQQRDVISRLLGRDADQELLDIVDSGTADEVREAILNSEFYANLSEDALKYLRDEDRSFLPDATKLRTLDSALEKIKDNYPSVAEIPVPTDEPNVEEITDEISSADLTDDEMQAMLDGEGIADVEDIEGEAPAEVRSSRATSLERVVEDALLGDDIPSLDEIISETAEETAVVDSEVIESSEEITDALSSVDLMDDQGGTEEPEIFAPGTPVNGAVILEGGTIIPAESVTAPNGTEYNVSAVLLPRYDGQPEVYDISVRDPRNPGMQINSATAATLSEAQALHADMINGLRDGTTTVNTDINFGRDVADVQAGDSSPYVTSPLLPNSPAERMRVIGTKAFREWQEQNNIYGDGVNQARLGDRVVHSYDGWNSRGEGTIVDWTTIQNSGDRARESYAVVVFQDGSYALWSTRMLFLNGRREGLEGRSDYAPPAQVPTAPELDPNRVRQVALTNKYTVEKRGRGGRKTKIIPYVSENQGTMVGETRRALEMWKERKARVDEYRRANGLPVEDIRPTEFAPPTTGLARIVWLRATGVDTTGMQVEQPTPRNLRRSATTPAAPAATPDLSPEQQRTRETDNLINEFNRDPENSSNGLSIDQPYIDVVLISDDTEPNNSVTIEWSENAQGWSLQSVSDNDPSELVYYADLDEAGAEAKRRLLEFRGESATPTPAQTPTPPAPTSGPTQEEGAEQRSVEPTPIPASQQEAYQQILDANLQAPGTYLINDISTADENLKGVYWAKEGYSNSTSARAVAITITPEGKFRTSAWTRSSELHRGTEPKYSDDFDTLNEAAAQANAYLAGRTIAPYEREEAGPAGSNPQILPDNPVTEAPKTYAYEQDIASYPDKISATPGFSQNLSVLKTDQGISMIDRITSARGNISYDFSTEKYVATVEGIKLPNQFDTVDAAGNAIMQNFLVKRETLDVPRSTGGTPARPYPLAPKEKRLNSREVENLRVAIEGRLSEISASAPVEVSIVSDDNSFTGLSYKISIPSVEHEMFLTQDIKNGGWNLSSLNADGTIKSTGQYRRTEEALGRIAFSSKTAFDGYYMARVASQRNRTKNLQEELKDYVPNSRTAARVDTAGPEGTWNYGFTHKPAGYVNGYEVDININLDGENTATVNVVAPDGSKTTSEISPNSDFDALLEDIKAKVDELASANNEESLAVKIARAEAKGAEVQELFENLELTPNKEPIYRRFLNRLMGEMIPVQQIEFDGSMQGVSDPNFDRVDENPVLTPNGDFVSQQYFQDKGWEAEKAAQIAHAGTARPSIEEIGRISRKPGGGGRELDEALSLVMGAGNMFGKALKVAKVTASGRISESGSSTLEVSVRIEDTVTGKTYNASRRFSFKDGKLDNVYNASMFIEGATPSGFSSLFNQYAENYYIANGANFITVSAQGGGSSTGAYVWAITGFNWNGASAGYDRLKAMHDMLQADRNRYITDPVALAKARSDMDMAVKQAFDAYGVSSWDELGRATRASGLDVNPSFPTPRELAMIGWTPNSRQTGIPWFGKSYMIDNSWGGRKNLDPTSNERVQNYSYEAMKTAVDIMAARGDNSFENNENIKSYFSKKETYEGDGAIIAPYADELTQLVGFDGSRSVTQLSPPAKAALGKYIATVLAKQTESDETTSDLVEIFNAIHKDRLALEPNRKELSAVGKTVSSLPSSVFDPLMPEGVAQGVMDPDTGEILPMTITKLTRPSAFDEASTAGPEVTGPTSGVSNIWRVQSEITGEVFFVKDTTSSIAAEAEVSSNALARSLGILGLPVVERYGDSERNMIITSELGTNLSIPALRTEELAVTPNESPRLDTPYLIKQNQSSLFDHTENDLSSRLNINNSLGMLALDAVIQNIDRGPQNIMMVRGNDVPNYSSHENVSESYIPIPFDNALSVTVQAAIEQNDAGSQSPYDYLKSSFGESNEIGKQFYDKLGPVAFKMLMDKVMDDALDRLRDNYGPYMPQEVLDAFVGRINQINEFTPETWTEIYG